MRTSNNEKISEPFLCTPCGGEPGNYILFYAGSCYEYNTPEIILAYGKQFGMKHIYFASEGPMYCGVYNGDTYVLYKDLELLPDDMKKDAERNKSGKVYDEYEIDKD